MIDLKELHGQLLDILIEFDRICRKNDIKYSLAYGTLLGAVRHKGFIPWDDDVDVMMDRENFDKFYNVCPRELNVEYFFQTKDSEPNYPYNICRIRKNNTAMIYSAWRNSGIHQGIYIDIYPVDNIADSRIKRAIQYLIIILMTPIRISKNPVIFNTGGQKFNKKIKNLIYKMSHFVPKKLCIKVEQYFITRYKKTKCKKMGIICEGGTLIRPSRDMRPFSTNYMENIGEIEFEEHTFMAIKDSSGLLQHWYGDYMKLPPEEKRVMYHQPDVFDTKNSYKVYIDA